MTPRTRAVLVRLTLVTAGCVGGFIILQEPFRWFETHAAVWLLQPFEGARVAPVNETFVTVYPIHSLPFLVAVTPSCSALASILALAGLASVLPRGGQNRRLVALVIAVVTVCLGNIVRIAASLFVGVLAGRSSLVLFHDWVGSMFSFVYTLGGYILMLYVVLGRRPRTQETELHAELA
jgi:carbamoyl-phosphate synthase large subunit